MRENEQNSETSCVQQQPTKKHRREGKNGRKEDACADDVRDDSDGISNASDESFSQSFSDSYDEESAASYVYCSEDKDGSSCSGITEEEKDYFGDSSVSGFSDDDDEESSQVAWEDSDENEDLREDYPSTAKWLSTDGLTKKITKKHGRIKFNLARKVFTTKYKIKLIRIFDQLTVIIDSFNLIYLIRKTTDFSVIKIDYFRVTDAVCLNGSIILCSAHSAYLKRLSLDGTVTDIRKDNGNIRRMATHTGHGLLYTLGNSLCVYNEKLIMKNIFKGDFSDICVSNSNVLALRENGDIFVFDHLLNFVRKCTFDTKFRFQGIFATDSHYFVKTETGFFVLDDALRPAKEFTNLKTPATALAHSGNFVVYGSDYQNSLRIIKDELEAYGKFPFSKVKIPPIHAMAFTSDSLYIGHSNSLSIMKISYSSG